MSRSLHVPPSHGLGYSVRAHVSAGYCLVQQKKATQALQEFQRARQMLPGSPTAEEALNLSSIAYRLYLRESEPPFAVSSKTVGPDVMSSGRVLSRL